MTPVIATQCSHLFVLQRTANYSVPAANAPVTEEEDRRVKAKYRERRALAANSPSGLGFVPNRKSALEATPEEREAVYEAAWNRLGFGFALTYYDILLSQPANDTAADFVRRKIAAVVEDPDVRASLTPRGFPFAARRPSVDSGYFQAFNRDNVTLVDLRKTPVIEFTETGVRTTCRRDRAGCGDFRHWLRCFHRLAPAGPKSRAREPHVEREWRRGPVTQFGWRTRVSRTFLSWSVPAAHRSSATYWCPPRNRSSGYPSYSLMRHPGAPNTKPLRRRGQWTSTCSAGTGDALPDNGVLLQRRGDRRETTGFHAVLGRGARLPASAGAGSGGRLSGFPLPWRGWPAAPPGIMNERLRLPSSLSANGAGRSTALGGAYAGRNTTRTSPAAIPAASS